MKHGLRRSLFLLLPLLALAPAEADASAVCDKLRERLTRTTEVVGSNAEARQYSGAIAQLNFRIRKARHDLRQFGCSVGSVVVIGGEQAAVCGEIENAVARLELDKRDLVRKRDDARANGALGPEARRRILASLEYNGCNAPEQDTRVTADIDPAERMQVDREAAALRNDAMISGLANEPLDPIDDIDRSRPLVGGTRGGSLRTVCVRTCDGGFFPISSNATSLDFSRDANVCSQMCPGIGTELFYHSIYSAEAADMISIATGRPYREMENAFGYRDRKAGEKSSCSCNLPAYYQEMQRRENLTSPAADENRSSVTEIKSKVPSSEAKDSVAKNVSERPERPYDPADQKIRKVGPEFLTKDGGKLDLTKPALEGTQPLQ